MSQFSTEMLERIEIELTRIRKMAEHADDGFLLYLLDMALLEVNHRVRFDNCVSDADDAQFLVSSNGVLPQLGGGT
jgi:hypothetical protein